MRVAVNLTLVLMASVTVCLADYCNRVPPKTPKYCLETFSQCEIFQGACPSEVDKPEFIIPGCHPFDALDCSANCQSVVEPAICYQATDCNEKRDIYGTIVDCELGDATAAPQYTTQYVNPMCDWPAVPECEGC